MTPLEMNPLDLEEVLDSNELIFVDCSVSESVTFFQDIYNHRDFQSFDPQFIIAEKEKQKDLLDIIKHPNAVTISDITEEIKNYHRILGEKISFFLRRDKPKNLKRKKKKNLSEEYNDVNGKRNSRCKRRDRRKSFKEKKISKNFRDDDHLEYPKIVSENLLKELHSLSFLISQTFRRKEVSTNHPQYNALLKMTKLISREMNLKEDTAHLFGNKYKDPYSSDTDEKLVTALYLQSLSQDKQPSLLTRDKDFLRLLGVVSRIIGQEDFYLHNKDFRETLRTNPIKLYLPCNRGRYLALDSSTLEFRPEFALPNILQERYFEVSQELRDLWQEFTDSSPLI